jgi:copper homeostasis protein
MSYKLEICADSVESAIIAQKAGADRIELCNNLHEGGTTPSYGCIVSAKKNLDIPVHVLIRPRGSDFLYNDLEVDIMRRDIEICGEKGVNGIVIGILRPDGTIDVEKTARLSELAHPMAVTFHRAFDMCRDPEQSLEDVISTGASRLLTSGRKNCAVDGMKLISRLVEKAGTRLIIMPGGGINETNVKFLLEGTKASEIHLTGRKNIDSDMIFRQEGVKISSMDKISEFTRKSADMERIKKIGNILHRN